MMNYYCYYLMVIVWDGGFCRSKCRAGAGGNLAGEQFPAISPTDDLHVAPAASSTSKERNKLAASASHRKIATKSKSQSAADTTPTIVEYC